MASPMNGSIRTLFRNVPNVVIHRVVSTMSGGQVCTSVSVRHTTEVSWEVSVATVRSVLTRAFPDADVSVAGMMVTVRMDP